MQTKLQRAHRRLDVLARCMLDYHPQRLSQTTIAEVLGVSHQAISKSLRRTDPNDPEVRRVAALLGWIKLATKSRLQGCARAHVRTQSMITAFSDAAFPNLSEDEGKSKSNLESQYAFAVAGK